ncbi:MAG: hypothetical protein JNG90_19110, partial [Planctomycetaceae bacterium]|nr:hypothetical protein [Planctomycetaceae bacterium]
YSIAWDVLLATPGDGNGDGLVDGADYTLWADHFLQTGATFGQGDYNADGIVDGADYTIWADNFSPGVSLALAIVPEPSGITLLATGCAAAAIAATTLWLVRRRQPSR